MSPETATYIAHRIIQIAKQLELKPVDIAKALDQILSWSAINDIINAIYAIRESE